MSIQKTRVEPRHPWRSLHLDGCRPLILLAFADSWSPARGIRADMDEIPQKIDETSKKTHEKPGETCMKLDERPCSPALSKGTSCSPCSALRAALFGPHASKTLSGGGPRVTRSAGMQSRRAQWIWKAGDCHSPQEQGRPCQPGRSRSLPTGSSHVEERDEIELNQLKEHV